MKIFLVFIVLATLSILTGTELSAQQTNSGNQNHRASYDDFGNTLNLGVGIGYYGYVGHSIPVLHADYEFNVARDFTLAPFIDYYRFTNYSYWGDPNNPYKDYYYRETVMPVGVKGSYYLNHLLHSSIKWDFYLGASIGFVIRSTTWDNGYGGNTTVSDGTGPLYLDLHIGTEYHINRSKGIFLDLSTGVSTLGVAIHF